MSFPVVFLSAATLDLKPWRGTLHGAISRAGFRVLRLDHYSLIAVIPTIVAALSGIRFQSECQRLAERSAVMKIILAGRPQTSPGTPNKGRLAQADRLAKRIQSSSTLDPTTNPGTWSHEVLNLTERIANAFVQEVAEWSVLYAKELVEPL